MSIWTAGLLLGRVFTGLDSPCVIAHSLFIWPLVFCGCRWPIMIVFYVLFPQCWIWQVSRNCESCHIEFGKYYCEVCRLFDNTDKKQFHCQLCGLCRYVQQKWWVWMQYVHEYALTMTLGSDHPDYPVMSFPFSMGGSDSAPGWDILVSQTVGVIEIYPLYLILVVVIRISWSIVRILWLCEILCVASNFCLSLAKQVSPWEADYLLLGCLSSEGNRSWTLHGD